MARVSLTACGKAETISIVVMDAGGGNSTTLATTAAIGVVLRARQLTWSPDGTSLIFQTSPVCDMTFDLFIVPTDGSSPATRLLTPGLEGRGTDWSPDGTQIAFVGRDATGSVGQYVVDAGGMRWEAGFRHVGSLPLTESISATSLGDPGGLQTGTELAAVSGTRDIVVVKPDGSEPRVVAEEAFNPAWSPDGRRLAFHRNVDPAEYFQGRPCTARAWVVDADGTNERQLDPLVEGCAPPPLWSPDGTRLAGLLIVATPDDPNPGIPLRGDDGRRQRSPGGPGGRRRRIMAARCRADPAGALVRGARLESLTLADCRRGDHASGWVTASGTCWLLRIGLVARDGSDGTGRTCLSERTTADRGAGSSGADRDSCARPRLTAR